MRRKRIGVPLADMIRDAVASYFQARSSLGSKEHLKALEAIAERAVGFGVDFKLVRLAQERELVGGHIWSPEALAVLKPLVEREVGDLFEPSKADPVEKLWTGLQVSKESVEAALFAPPKPETETETGEGIGFRLKGLREPKDLKT